MQILDQNMEIDPHSPDHTPVLLASLGYQEVREIGKGSFGQVYSISTPQGLRAIKTELKSNIKPMLVLQYEMMECMKDVEGFPQVYQYQELEEINFMEMQIFKKSLDKLLKESNNQFSIKTTLIIMIQVLERLRQLHSRGFIYRDVKPSNFMVGNDPNLIYILDFGLVKRIGKGRPVSPTKNKKSSPSRLVGTPIFCSIGAHSGQNQGAKDDLESLVYMGVFFTRPLPWENIVEEDKLLKQEKIRQIKSSTRDEDLCKDLPKQFLQFLKKVRSYSQEQVPEYQQLRSLLQQALKSLDPKKNVYPEWMQPAQQKPKQEVKINFQIKPKIKKKVEIPADKTFQQIIEKKQEDTKNADSSVKEQISEQQIDNN